MLVLSGLRMQGSKAPTLLTLAHSGSRNINLIAGFTTFSATLVGLSFVFGNSIRTMYARFGLAHLAALLIFFCLFSGACNSFHLSQLLRKAPRHRFESILFLFSEHPYDGTKESSLPFVGPFLHTCIKVTFLWHSAAGNPCVYMILTSLGE